MGLTLGADCDEDHSSSSEAGGDANDDFGDGARWVRGLAGAVGAERNVVRCSSTHTRRERQKEYGVSKKPSYVKGRER